MGALPAGGGNFWPRWLVRLTAWVDRWTTPAHWARARKYLVALMGVAVQLLAAGLIPAPWASRVQLVLGLLTAVGVYQVPNAPAVSSPTADPDAVAGT